MTERLPHHELQLLLGAYVLGGLDADDRRLLEEHLPSCKTCTAELARFAAVPGLLQLAPAPAPEPVTAPEDSLPKLISAANAERSTRQRRRWMLAAAAVALVLSGVAGGLLLVDRNTGPTPTEVVSTADAHVVGSAVLSAREWGTEVHLELDYLPRGSQPYTAWAVDRYGHEEQAAAWRLPPGGRCSVTGATSFPRTELDRIEVRSADGKTLLHTR
jgi:anti-sigma-K factor RskA